jgi:hypothetical protein
LLFRYAIFGIREGRYTYCHHAETNTEKFVIGQSDSLRIPQDISLDAGHFGIPINRIL